LSKEGGDIITRDEALGVDVQQVVDFVDGLIVMRIVIVFLVVLQVYRIG
jgi:hypothetical protein